MRPRARLVRSSTVVVTVVAFVLASCAYRQPLPPPVPGPVVVNVVELGATGDGTTDDRPAIQAALDRAGAGASVYFPPGTYRLASASSPQDRILVTQPDQRLVGAGRDSSRLAVGAGFGNYVTVIGAQRDQVGVGSWSLRGLTIDQNASAGNLLLTAQMLQYPKMAVRLGDYDPSSSVTVSDSSFLNSDSVNALYLFAGRTAVNNNRFSAIGGPVGLPPHDHSTVYVTATSEGGVQQVAGNTFQGVRFSGGATTAIETHGGVQQITDNRVSDYLRGMNVTGTGSVLTARAYVARNTIEGAAIGAQLWSAVGPQDHPGLSSVDLSDNSVGLDGAAWALAWTAIPTAGVLVNASNSAPIAGLTISGNKIRFSSVNQAHQLQPSTAGVVCLVDVAAARPVGLSIAGNSFAGAPTAIQGSCLVDGALVRDNTVS